MKILVALFLLLVPTLALASGYDCGVQGGRLVCGVPGTGGCILICDNTNTNCSCTESGEQETDAIGIGLRGGLVQRVPSQVLAAKIGAVATLHEVITACEQTPGCSYQVQPSGATGGHLMERNFRLLPFSWGSVKVIYR